MTIGAIYALDAATGEERWHFTTGDAVGISPALVGKVLYFPSSDRTLYAVDVASGEEVWRFPIDGIALQGPTVLGGVAYIGTSFGNLYAIGSAGGDGAPSASPASD